MAFYKKGIQFTPKKKKPKLRKKRKIYGRIVHPQKYLMYTRLSRPVTATIAALTGKIQNMLIVFSIKCSIQLLFYPCVIKHMNLYRYDEETFGATFFFISPFLPMQQFRTSFYFFLLFLISFKVCTWYKSLAFTFIQIVYLFVENCVSFYFSFFFFASVCMLLCGCIDFVIIKCVVIRIGWK